MENKKISGVKAVLFDLDGTLLESMHVWADIDKRFLGLRGIEVPPDYMDKTAVMDFYHAAAYTIERFGLSESPETLIAEWKDVAVYEYEHNVKLKPHAKEYLLRLKENGLRLAVVTSSDKAVFTAALKTNGIESFFERVFSASGTDMIKGDGGIYRLALNELGVSGNDAVLFEDAYEAVIGGKKAGLKVVAVKTPFTCKTDAEFLKVADYCITDFNDAPEIEL